MRLGLCAAALALCLGAGAARADTALSAEIGSTGLAATETRLTALPAPTDADRFALSGVRFLRVVEQALQTRWRHGLTEQMRILPFLRLPLKDNPAPVPPAPDVIAALFRNVASGMETARAPLADIPATSDFGLEIAVADLWFDINANASRDPGEGLADVAGVMLLGQSGEGAALPVIRFDAADAAWLSAYTHLLGGLADVVLAYDPTEAITRILAARAGIAAIGGLSPDPIFGGGDNGGPDTLDLIAIVLATLDQAPDKARALSAHGHFLSMIADNRDFWARVATETDNDREWLPNDAQQSALGIAVPPGTGAVWQSVLADGEALLTGRVLAPYWRLQGGGGLNVGRMFTDPRPIDLAEWIQGAGALPYLEKGPVVSMQSWQTFSDLMQGEAMLMTVFLN